MYTNEVALRYAMALASYAAQNKMLDTFEKELNEIDDTLKKTEDLQTFLTHPKIRPEEKQELLTEIFGFFSKEMLNFLSLLIEKKRWSDLNQIRLLYIREANLYRGRVQVEVETAFALDGDMERQLHDRLETVTNRPIDLNFKTSPDLIGGLKVKIGHQVIDGSVQNQLRELKRDLLEQKGRSRGES